MTRARTDTACLHRGQGDDQSHPADIYLIDWFNNRSVPLCLVEADLTLLWANLAAVRHLEEGLAIVSMDGKLRRIDGDPLASLHSLVNTTGLNSSVWVDCADDKRQCVVHVQPILAVPGAPVYGLTLHFAAAVDSYLWADFGPALGLTRAQCGVAQMLYEGQTTHEVAMKQGISLETVRTHVKRIYRKLSINSREQLFALINAYRIQG